MAERLDKKVQVFAERRDEELKQLYTDTQESLGKLRARLLLVMSAATFAATVAGTWFLVWLGLCRCGACPTPSVEFRERLSSRNSRTTAAVGIAAHRRTADRHARTVETRVRP